MCLFLTLKRRELSHDTIVVTSIHFNKLTKVTNALYKSARVMKHTSNLKQPIQSFLKRLIEQLRNQESHRKVTDQNQNGKRNPI